MEQVEFSRLMDVARLGDAEVTRTIAATADERAALARRLGLVSLDRLEVDARLRRRPGSGLVELRAHYTAALSQACVVTLAPVPSRLDQTFSQLYDPAAGAADNEAAPTHARHVSVDPVAADPPEPIGPGGIDLGEAVVQHLAVTLDPYPRAPNARLDALGQGPSPAAPEEGGGAGARGESPFAVLRRLKPRG
ncbi:MAG: DUF177 domain-containing protein [Kiloniellaceae bacterium]